MELKAEAVIIDDEDARAAARGLGLAVTGVVGLLLTGREKGLVKWVRQELDGLVAIGFHISPKPVFARTGNELGDKAASRRRSVTVTVAVTSRFCSTVSLRPNQSR